MENSIGTMKDTIDGMLSKDWKERLLAEYRQTRIRFLSLESFLILYENHELDDAIDLEMNPIEVKVPYLLYKQLEALRELMDILEARLEVEGVDYKNG